jgi:diketogulonate reductase-like aldo/keto reductase
MQVQAPRIIYGTAWKKGDTSGLVLEAIESGFRGIDTACQPRHYREDLVGVGLAQAIAKGVVKREDVFLQTKFSPIDAHDPNSIPYNPNAEVEEQVRQSIQVSLKNLQTPYIDSVVLHSPLATMELTTRAWRVLEECVDQGLVRQLGVSNEYDASRFVRLYDAVRVKPSVLQNRFYVDSGYDVDLRSFCAAKHIRYQSFWTLTANPHVLQSVALKEAAKRRSVSVEEAMYRYVMDLGITPLCGTTNKNRMERDSRIPLEVKPLDEEELRACNAALIRPQKRR